MGLPEGYLVAVVRSGQKIQKFAAPQDLWYLDQIKYDRAFRSRGLIPPPGYPDTFGVPVVDGEPAVSTFLQGVRQYEASDELLRSELAAAAERGDGEELRLLPSVFVDFDARHFASMEFEPLGFERYLPDGWTFSFGDVMERVPPDARYWKPSM